MVENKMDDKLITINKPKTGNDFIINILLFFTIATYSSIIGIYSQNYKKNEKTIVTNEKKGTLEKFREDYFSLIISFIVSISLLILFQISNSDHLVKFIITIIAIGCNILLIMLLNNNVNLHNSDKLSINAIIPICLVISVVKIIFLILQYKKPASNESYLGIIQDVKVKNDEAENVGVEDGKVENESKTESELKHITVPNESKSVIYGILNVAIICVCIAILALKNKTNKDDKNISRLFTILNVLLTIDIVILLPIYSRKDGLNYDKIIKKLVEPKLMEKYKIRRANDNYEKELDKVMYNIIKECYNKDCKMNDIETQINKLDSIGIASTIPIATANVLTPKPATTPVPVSASGTATI